MKKTKILLIGSKGQVGQELEQILPNLGELISVDRTQLDLTNSAMISSIIEQNKPNIIVNSAAYTAVDKAESEPELAQQVNAIAPKIMAEESQKIGTKLIHISTDYVFDGTKNIPYLETDFTNPMSVYGKTKLAGEENIKQTGCNYIILRTAWVYGVYGKGNFVKTMLRLGKEKEQLKVVMDQVGTPTYAQNIAQTIANLITQILPENQVQETYHFTNLGVCSWYDFAVTIFEEARKRGYPLTIKEVIPITTPEYPTPAKRPAYSVLSNKKITADVGYYPNYWRNSLSLMLDQLLSC
jgi:dTDP-4-dehydrorhamnose reductase